MKKILAVIEVGNEVINSEILNSETLLLQAFRKFASFLLVLDLMYELYVTSFLEIFHFLIWRGTCFDAYFHNFSDVSKLFLALRRHENNEKLKLSSTIKTRAHSLLVTFDVLRLHVVTAKKINLGMQCFVFWFI